MTAAHSTPVTLDAVWHTVSAIASSDNKQLLLEAPGKVLCAQFIVCFAMQCPATTTPSLTAGNRTPAMMPSDYVFSDVTHNAKATTSSKAPTVPTPTFALTKKGGTQSTLRGCYGVA